MPLFAYRALSAAGERVCGAINAPTLAEPGEASGTLAAMLMELVSLRAQHEATRIRITLAMLYPELVLLTAIATAATLLIFVVPNLRPLFEDPQQLPLITR